jgi:hypothetical protein
LGYPTSVFSPSARSNGQTIDASHVNDVQTELTAIENALLGTITHSVNVSGASTLATLQAAASTFTVRPVTPPPHAALVFLESTATIGSSGASTLAFTGQAILTNSSAHSTGTNPERLTPQSTGLYQFAAQVGFSPTTGALPSFVLRDSSGANIASARQLGSSRETFVQCMGYKRFDVLGGYMTCVLSPEGFSTLSISTAFNVTWFAMHKL